MRESSRPACGDIRNLFHTPRFSRNASIRSSTFHLSLASIMFLFGIGAAAQVNVLTQHNDNARTGQNLQETILTPSNVNPTQFGKLFSQPVNGEIYGQPLYVSNVAISGKGTHDVMYVATTALTPNKAYTETTNGDSVYAFDADTNGGSDATPLWQVSLLTNTTPAGTLLGEYGVLGTPVIDPASQTMYVVSSELQNSTTSFDFTPSISRPERRNSAGRSRFRPRFREPER